MFNLTEWLTMIERAQQVARIFEGQNKVIDTALDIVESATRYTRLGIQLDKDMAADVKEAADLLQQIIDDNGRIDDAALDAQLERLKANSATIAANTEKLRAQLEG
ncbi:hypothetical protein [Henriciella aquimarina]|uniref:hypothetical protein n=1 Tax=Henriciella aquimarina TaxID=545261 RepID=UPI000A01682D|nr:hypothetical protein [Henriciella aquimarina]